MIPRAGALAPSVGRTTLGDRNAANCFFEFFRVRIKPRSLRDGPIMTWLSNRRVHAWAYFALIEELVAGEPEIESAAPVASHRADGGETR